MEDEKIGIGHIDNGVSVFLWLTGDGLRWSLSDVRDENIATKLWKSPEMVMGVAIERGYMPAWENFEPKKMVLTMAIYNIRDKLDVSCDEAKDILEL